MPVEPLPVPVREQTSPLAAVVVGQPQARRRQPAPVRADLHNSAMATALGVPLPPAFHDFDGCGYGVDVHGKASKPATLRSL